MRELKAVPFHSVHGVHKGRAGILLCGGPSLPEQFNRVWADLPGAVLMSANHHGAKLTRCDYIIANDNWRKFCPTMMDFETPIIGPKKDSDFRLVSWPNIGNTGMQAAWALYVLGCCPIVICGADCFATGTYWWDDDFASSGFRTPPSQHVQKWEYTMREHCPIEIMRAADGPLVQVFGRWDPAEEKSIAVITTKPFRRIHGVGVMIEMLRNTLVDGEPFHRDEVLEVSSKTAKMLYGIKKARPYTGSMEGLHDAD